MIQNPITLQQQRKVWSIHQSVNGITYYYNRATKKSQYEMPQCFKTTQQDTQHPEWKQYRTAEGKKFYYNAMNRKSSWQLPNQVKQYKKKIEEQKRKQKEINGGVEIQEKLSEQEEKKRKIIQLFKYKSVNVNTKWQSCIKMCQDDERWALMKISDKKKIFNDYIMDLKKINQMEKKAKTQINKAQFIKMLKQAKFLTSDSKMHKVAYDFMTDTRWRILDQIDKQNTFQDYLDQLYTKQRQLQKQSKQKNIDSLRLLIQQQQIAFNFKWDQFRPKFKQFQCYKSLHPYDRLSVFIDYIMDIQKKHQQQIHKQKRLKQRYNRINFRNMLKEKLLSGELGYKTKWRGFVNQNKDDKALINMMDPQQQGSPAQEIFQNFMYEIRNNHKLLKNQIKQHFKKKQFKMTQQTNYQQFSEKLKDLQQYTKQKDFIRYYFHKYFISKIKSKNQNKQLNAKKTLKKQKKLIFKIFKQLKDNLKTKYSIEDHMQKISQGMKQNGISITHQSIFKYYLVFLQSSDDKKKQYSRSRSPRSRSNSYSSASSIKIKKRNPHTHTHGNSNTNNKNQISQQQGSLKKFIIPEELKIKGNLMMMNNDMEEEGEIKDDDVESQKKDKKKKDKQKEKQREKQRDRERDRGNKKKKRNNSSSDSD